MLLLKVLQIYIDMELATCNHGFFNYLQTGLQVSFWR